MKKTFCAIALVASSTLFSVAVSAAPVSSSGWYYTTVSYAGSQPQFGHVGPFSTSNDCNVARNNDYGDGGALPWDGGPGCFYLYDNDIDAYNEILEEYNFVSGSGDTPNGNVEFQQLLDSVNLLIDEHGIRDYRKSLKALAITSRTTSPTRK